MKKKTKPSGSLPYLNDERRLAGDQPAVETRPCAGAGLQFDSAASCLLLVIVKRGGETRDVQGSDDYPAERVSNPVLALRDVQIRRCELLERTRCPGGEVR